MELFLQELAKLGDRFYLAFVAADRWKLYLSGLGNTLAITLGAICISTVLGMLLCLMKISRYRILRGPAKAYIDVIRGIPVVVQLMFIYFVVLVTWTNKTAVGIIAFGLNSAAYTAEIFRSGILAVDKGQMEAGRSLGLTHGQTMWSIIFPQGIKNCLPTCAGEGDRRGGVHRYDRPDQGIFHGTEPYHGRHAAADYHCRRLLLHYEGTFRHLCQNGKEAEGK